MNHSQQSAFTYQFINQSFFLLNYSNIINVFTVTFRYISFFLNKSVNFPPKKKTPLQSYWQQTIEQNYYIHWITKNKQYNVVIFYKNIVAFQI